MGGRSFRRGERETQDSALRRLRCGEGGRGRDSPRKGRGRPRARRRRLASPHACQLSRERGCRRAPPRPDPRHDEGGPRHRRQGPTPTIPRPRSRRAARRRARSGEESPRRFLPGAALLRCHPRAAVAAEAFRARLLHSAQRLGRGLSRRRFHAARAGARERLDSAQSLPLRGRRDPIDATLRERSRRHARLESPPRWLVGFRHRRRRRESEPRGVRDAGALVRGALPRGGGGPLRGERGSQVWLRSPAPSNRGIPHRQYHRRAHDRRRRPRSQRRREGLRDRRHCQESRGARLQVLARGAEGHEGPTHGNGAGGATEGQPGANQLSASQPNASQPAASQPAASQPASSQPASHPKENGNK